MRETHKESIHRKVLAGIVLMTALALVILFSHIFIRGIENWHSGFLTDLPQDGGRAGGIYPVIYSTALILFCCMSFVIPLGLGCSVHLYLLHITKPKNSSIFLICSDVLASIPSIIFGLLGATLFCDILNLGYSILSGGLTLACMTLPLFIRLNDQIFKSIPKDWIKASYSLGISQWRFLFQIIIPKFLPQFTGALIISLGRALSETAALLFTSGYVLRTPESIFDSGRSLSIHIYELSMNLPGGDGPAAASALFLFGFLMLSTILAQSLNKKWTRL